jgi:hypothetical protein
LGFPFCPGRPPRPINRTPARTATSRSCRHSYPKRRKPCRCPAPSSADVFDELDQFVEAAGPTRFLYRYRFSSEKGETVVTLDAEVELPCAAAIPLQLARRAIRSGVDDNLAALKRILENRPLLIAGPG